MTETPTHSRRRNTMAKAKKTPKANGSRAKQQPELPGAERPDDPELFSACGDFIDAKAEQDIAKTKVGEARAVVTTLLQERAEILERDKHGNPTYVFSDGERSRAFHLVTGQKVTVEVLDGDEA
jgi:hypothetical protein